MLLERQIAVKQFMTSRQRPCFQVWYYFLLVVWWGSNVHGINWTRQPQTGSRLDGRGFWALSRNSARLSGCIQISSNCWSVFSPVLPCFRSGTFEHGTLLKGNLIRRCGVQWQVLDLNILAWMVLSVDLTLTSTLHNSNKLSPKLRLNF